MTDFQSRAEEQAAVLPVVDKPIPPTWQIIAEIEADLDRRGLVVHPVTFADVIAAWQERQRAEEGRAKAAVLATTTPDITAK